MKSALLIFLVSFLLNISLSAQHASIPLTKFKLDDVQGIAVNDSLLVIIKANYRDDNFRAMWVLPTGNVKNININELKNKAICTVQNSADSTFFYYFEAGKEEIIIKVLAQSLTTGLNKISSKQLMLSGELLGMYADKAKGLVLVSSLLNDRKLLVTQLSHLDIIKQNVFQVTEDLHKIAKSIAFIPEGAEVRPIQAEATTKIYKIGDAIFIGIDNPFIDEEQPIYKTTIIKLDLQNGTTQIKAFYEKTTNPFRTFITGKYIFKVIQNKKNVKLNTIYSTSIAIYDFDLPKLVTTVTIDKHSSINDSTYFIRNEAKNTALMDTPISKVFDRGTAPFISTIITGGDFTLKVGKHMTVSKGYSPIVSGLGPVVFIATAAISMAVLSASGNHSIDFYYYMNWDEKSNIRYSSKSRSIGQQIDQFETAEEFLKKKFSYKGYVHSENLSYGMYEEKDSHMLTIAKFVKD